jgi:hypothetical protein
MFLHAYATGDLRGRMPSPWRRWRPSTSPTRSGASRAGPSLHEHQAALLRGRVVALAPGASAPGGVVRRQRPLRATPPGSRPRATIASWR